MNSLFKRLLRNRLAGTRRSSRRLHTQPHSHPHPLLATFSRLCVEGPFATALALLPDLASVGLRADPVSLTRLVKLCVRHGTASDGRLIHRHVAAYGAL